MRIWGSCQCTECKTPGYLKTDLCCQDVEICKKHGWPIYSKSLYLYYTILELEQCICRNVLDVDKTIRYLFGSLLFLQYEEISLHIDKSNIDDIAF